MKEKERKEKERKEKKRKEKKRRGKERKDMMYSKRFQMIYTSIFL
jgi:hypothetical protein